MTAQLNDELNDQANDIEVFRKEIKGIKIAMLTTKDHDGLLRSRPMATQDAEFDGTLWFFTRDESPKVNQIQDNEQVNVAYSDPSGNRYVSAAGSATIVRDRAKIKELWTPAMKGWFPDGVDDPQIALIRVDVEGAQYWDFPSKTLVQLTAFVKSVVTGQTLKTDKAKHTIDFKH